MRNLVVVGNCQAEVVAQGLGHPVFSSLLSVKYQFVELPDCKREQARQELFECDTVLVQDISNFDNYPLRTAIPARAQTVSFPCLRLASPWPFDSQNGPGDARARAHAAEPPVFTHFDGQLGRLRAEIPDAEARFQAYRSLTLEGVVNLPRMQHFEERRLRGLDARFDCTIGGFILDNFRSARLFCSTGEPRPALYRMLLQWLLQRLGIAGDYPDDDFLAAADTDEVPVHPAVARALDVAWADETTIYRFQGGQLCWEDYVRLYIDHFG